MKPEIILKATAKHFGIAQKKLKQKKRGPWPISWPRLLGMAIAYESNKCAQVGHAFNRTHGNVIHASKRVADLCDVHEDLAGDREALKCRLMN